MKIELLFTGLMLFVPDDSGVNLYFLKASGHTAKVDLRDRLGKPRSVPIGTSARISGMEVVRTEQWASFAQAVPSVNALSGKVSLGSVDSKKFAGLVSLRLTGGSLSAEGGNVWCEFTAKKSKSAGYATLSSVVRWRGTATDIYIDETKLDLSGVAEIEFRNDMDDHEHAVNHFGAYFDLLGKTPTADVRPIPCRTDSDAAKLTVDQIMKKGDVGQAVAKGLLTILYHGNPLLCPPAQQ